MHQHANGQLEYVGGGSMQLLTPDSCWIVPRNKLVWIPPAQLHSVRADRLTNSWKIMIPKAMGSGLPKEIAILKGSPLLVSALAELPTGKNTVARARLNLLKEIIRQELGSVETESFSVNLPKSPKLDDLTRTLLKHPEDPRGINEWAQELGMSRRAFTRLFMTETGSSFGVWKKDLLLSKSLTLITSGKNVSEVADTLGYASPSAFIFAFRKKYGSSPKQFHASM